MKLEHRSLHAVCLRAPRLPCGGIRKSLSESHILGEAFQVGEREASADPHSASHGPNRCRYSGDSIKPRTTKFSTRCGSVISEKRLL